MSYPIQGVALLMIDNGPSNFLTWALNDELEAALGSREDHVSVLVIGSAVEGFFIAHGHLGDNVETFTGGQPSGDSMSGLRVLKQLDTGPLISIAAVDGQAWGGGAELAWACDLRVATERSSFAQVEIRLGVTPVGGAARIAHLAGESAAKRLVLDGRPIDGAEAHRIGLVDRLAPAGEAIGAALGWAEWLASHPAGALARSKALITEQRPMSVRDALRAELQAYVETFSAPESIERARRGQTMYDTGASSSEVFGLP